MVYLDYSATTFVDKRVLENFNKNVLFGANPNSKHALGKKNNELLEESINNISLYLGTNDQEIIFTSGASESNNTALKGIFEEYNIKKIITTKLEHSSITSPLNYLMKNGVNVEFISLDKDGRVDIKSLLSMITDEFVLVSICAVDSELGIRQPIEEIASVLKEKINVVFHTDMTQCIGKDNIEIEDVDLASFSMHKLYGFKGIGGLIKKKDIELTPLIHGGKSTTLYRSGTPQFELILSIENCLSLLIPSLKEKFDYVSSLNESIKEELKKYNNIVINGTAYSIPHILNFSIIGKNANDTMNYFSNNNIFISTTSACSNGNISLVVNSIYNDEARAMSSVRVSLSYKTTMEEIEEFKRVLKEYMNENN